MTGLDIDGPIPGYFNSPWPAECGGARRQKVVGSPGIGLQPGESLHSTVRDIEGWSVMLVQREGGGLYLQCGAGSRGAGLPEHRTADSDGWVERIDPRTMETIVRSPDLASGGWIWCGALLVHANGDLYSINGNRLYRLDPECNILAERQLPVDGPYNGLAVMADGNLVSRNLGFRDTDLGCFVVLEPERLETVSESVLSDRCMGRFSVDLTPDGQYVYTTTPTDVRRLRYVDGELELDNAWQRRYTLGSQDQSDAWDTTIAAGSVWHMDMGRPGHWRTPGTASQRAFRFSIADPDSYDVIEGFDRPSAWNPGPPLYDPTRQVLVHYDAANGGVIAHRVRAGERPECLWRSEARNFAQMMIYADTGELIIEDTNLGSRGSAHIVVLDIETGTELGRCAIGAPVMGMFMCPGFERDFYVASLLGPVTRVTVQGSATSN